MVAVVLHHPLGRSAEEVSEDGQASKGRVPKRARIYSNFLEGSGFRAALNRWLLGQTIVCFRIRNVGSWSSHNVVPSNAFTQFVRSKLVGESICLRSAVVGVSVRIRVDFSNSQRLHWREFLFGSLPSPGCFLSIRPFSLDREPRINEICASALAVAYVDVVACSAQDDGDNAVRAHF